MINLIKINRFLLVFILIFIVVGCNNKAEQSDKNDSLKVNNADIKLELNSKVKNIFFNVPSPLEIAAILSKSGTNYKQGVLNKPENVSKYLTNSELALNFGVYASDISFARMMNKTTEAIKYLTVIKKISDELGIPQEKGTFAVSRLEKNINNRDSILQIISDLYFYSDTYLKDNERADIAALVVLGGWIEAIYIATNIIEKNKYNKEIANYIAEQKFSLINLIDLVKKYKYNQDIIEFLPDLERLKEVFDKISINYNNSKIETNKQSKITVITSKTTITVTPEIIDEIKIITDKIRNNIIQ